MTRSRESSGNIGKWQIAMEHFNRTGAFVLMGRRYNEFIREGDVSVEVWESTPDMSEDSYSMNIFWGVEEREFFGSPQLYSKGVRVTADFAGNIAIERTTINGEWEKVESGFQGSPKKRYEMDFEMALASAAATPTIHGMYQYRNDASGNKLPLYRRVFQE